MEQTVRVSRLLPDDVAEVIRVRQSACCGDCHQCAGCGAAKETLVLRARNLIGARPGDLVVIESGSSSVLKAAAVLYILPLVLFLLGYLLGAQLWGRGIWMGLAAGLLSLIPIWLCDRHLAKKKTVYCITAFAGEHSC